MADSFTIYTVDIDNDHFTLQMYCLNIVSSIYYVSKHRSYPFIENSQSQTFFPYGSVIFRSSAVSVNSITNTNVAEHKNVAEQMWHVAWLY